MEICWTKEARLRYNTRRNIPVKPVNTYVKNEKRIGKKEAKQAKLKTVPQG
jgi:hypothetical protein